MHKNFKLQLNNIQTGQNRPKGIPKSSVKKLGILGSGLMGHGICYVAAINGIDVLMIDVSIKKAQRGLDKIESILEDAQNKGLITKNKKIDVLNKITISDDYSFLRECDLIVEAVFEDRILKNKVTNLAEKFMDDNAIFASNTSTIPISILAKESMRPNNFIGIHFFSPVHKMKLVEIIKTKTTSLDTLAKAYDFALCIGKIPIVVNDSRGFYTTRVFERYTSEGMALLYEGNPAELIESSGKEAGYPVGPLAILDEINIGLAAHIRNQKRLEFQENGRELHKQSWDKVLSIMINDVKRLGRSDGGGFYEYPESNVKYIWPNLENYFPISKNVLAKREMIDRMIFSQVIETIRCYEEGVLLSVADANVGSVFGWGFPIITGGTLQYVNDYGLKEFLRKSKTLSKLFGERFSAPELLIEMASQNKKFN